jgi:peptide deformylase
MRSKELHIVEFGDPVLRKKCRRVELIDSSIIRLIDGMKSILHNKPGRAAIASSQVGKLLRIVVIDYEKDYCELINPEIIEMIGNEIDYEGCLSFPNFSGRVDRAKIIKVKYFDRDMKEKKSNCK